jgi:hypothetical protein
VFDDFMDSDEAWARCEAYWERLLHDVESSLGQHGEWEAWGSNRFANGTLMEREFRTMCSRRSPTLARGLQIYQDPLGDEAPWIFAWVERDEEMHVEVEDWPSFHLTIRLRLTQDMAVTARELIEKWLTPSTTPDDMEELINRVAKPPDPSTSD